MTDEEYYEFIQPYEDAKQMLLTRLDVLNHNLYGEASARPIHNIQCRIKKKQSIEEKLQRKGKEPTVMNAKDYLQDIAGVREDVDGVMYRTYKLLRGSHTYDTAEMARLIDGLVTSCKEAGIPDAEIASPDEKRILKERYGVDIG